MLSLSIIAINPCSKPMAWHYFLILQIRTDSKMTPLAQGDNEVIELVGILLEF